MERTTWTDERLDDAMTRIDGRFDRLEADMRAGFAEMRAGFAELRNAMDANAGELRRGQHLILLGYGVGFLSLAAALIAAG